MGSRLIADLASFLLRFLAFADASDSAFLSLEFIIPRETFLTRRGGQLRARREEWCRPRSSATSVRLPFFSRRSSRPRLSLITLVIVVANGHYSDPFIPYVQGLWNYKGKVTHRFVRFRSHLLFIRDLPPASEADVSTDIFGYLADGGELPTSTMVRLSSSLDRELRFVPPSSLSPKRLVFCLRLTLCVFFSFPRSLRVETSAETWLSSISLPLPTPPSPRSTSRRVQHPRKFTRTVQLLGRRRSSSALVSLSSHLQVSSYSQMVQRWTRQSSI